MEKQTFKYSIRVQAGDLDSLQHVNNEVYIKWLLQGATAHSTYLGYSLERFLNDGACFVVRRHEVDYLAPTFLHEELTLETWIEEINGMRCTRLYKIIRNRDERLLVSAKTKWVYINLKDGRPTEIPDPIISAFSNYVHN